MNTITKTHPTPDETTPRTNVVRDDDTDGRQIEGTTNAYLEFIRRFELKHTVARHYIILQTWASTILTSRLDRDSLSIPLRVILCQRWRYSGLSAANTRSSGGMLQMNRTTTNLSCQSAVNGCGGCFLFGGQIGCCSSTC